MGPSMVQTHCQINPVSSSWLFYLALAPGSPIPGRGCSRWVQLSLRNGQTSCDETGETGKDSETLDGGGGLLGKEKGRTNLP